MDRRPTDFTPHSGQACHETSIFPGSTGCERLPADLTESDAWPFFYFSRALIERGRHDEALEAIGRGLDLIHSKGSLFWDRGVQNALLSQQLLALVFSGEEEKAKSVLDSLDSSRNARPEIIVCAAYVRASLGLSSPGSTALSAFEAALSRLNATQARRRHTRAQIHLFRGRLHEAMSDLGKAETEYGLASQTDPHNVYMKVCMLKVLIRIARAANANGNLVAATSAAQKAAEISTTILAYDPNQKDAQYAQEDLYREFGIE